MTNLMVKRSIRALAVVVAFALLIVASPRAAATVNGVLPGVNLYPRVIELANAGVHNGTVLATTNNGVEGRVWKSTDEGETFTLLSTVQPGADALFLCCIALWEFPVALGPFPAGTLLWAGSVGTDMGSPKHMALRVWRSDDHGLSWSPMSACTSTAAGGLWEPDFHVANDGSLVCLFSDETDQPAHSQILAQTVSSDGGQTWGPKQPVVVDPASWKRPGMPTVAQLPDGSWVMTYEVCAAFPHCHIRIRRSNDGLDWGPPEAPGDKVLDTSGGYLAHTPVVTWTPAGGTRGSLVLSGQLLFTSSHAIAPGNGRTLLVNTQDGAGRWTPIDAPVPVDDPTDEPCPNYSSPVIDLDGNGLLLGLASSWQGQDCVTAFGTARVAFPAGPVTSSTIGTTTPSTTADGTMPAAEPINAAPTFTG